ncbi:MAG: hypothetical protein ABIR46_02125 [Candidatus Saccharimonadales bacterium]
MPDNHSNLYELLNRGTTISRAAYWKTRYIMAFEHPRVTQEFDDEATAQTVLREIESTVDHLLDARVRDRYDPPEWPGQPRIRIFVLSAIPTAAEGMAQIGTILEKYKA